MTCTLPEHITEQLAASEERFHNLEKNVALIAECVKVKGQLLRFEVMADDTKQLQFSTGMTFESWKVWWDYLKSTAARVVSKGHQILTRGAGKLPLAKKLSFTQRINFS